MMQKDHRRLQRQIPTKLTSERPLEHDRKGGQNLH